MSEPIRIAAFQIRETYSVVDQALWVRAQNVTIMASVGIYPGEKHIPQVIVLNVAAEVLVPLFDQVDQTVDYRRLVEEAHRLTQEGHFELIETLACELGRRLLSLQNVSAIEVELFKPAAIPPAMASVRYHARRRVEPSDTASFLNT
jgi:dihydroneopterin aldolase